MTQPLVIQRLVARAQRYLRDNPNDLRQLTAEVRQWVQNPCRAPIEGAYPLHRSGVWHAHVGVAAVERDERWPELERSFSLEVLRLRLKTAHWIGRSRPDWMPIERFFTAGMLSAWAIWWNNTSVASWLGHLMTDPDEMPFSMGEPEVPAEWFLGMLHPPALASVPPDWLDTDMLPYLGPYAPLIEYLYRGGPVPHAAFHTLCEYHAEQALDEYHGVYRDTPWDLFPVELLAFQRRCEQYGLEPPRSDHPIVNTPLCEPHELTEPPEDLRPLVAAVDQACVELQGSKR